MGTGTVSNYDASGQLIYDPENANRNYGYGANYSVFVGYFYVIPLNRIK